MKLTIELVPSTAWNSSMYNYFKKNNQMDIWKQIKMNIFEKEGKICWVCGKKDCILEAHEFWSYNDKEHIQKLKGIHHLCSLCHMVKHIGLWLHTDKGAKKLKEMKYSKEDIIKHFCKVNKCSKQEFTIHENKAFILHKKRSKFNWKQNLGKYELFLKKIENKKLFEFIH